jgi:hypothetical protein
MRVQQKPESQIFDLRQLAVQVLKLVLVSLTFPFGFRVNGWRESDDKTAWLGRHAACPIGCSARAADVTGHWRVTITTPDGSMTGVALFKQSGDAVTGWVGPSEDDPITITGVVKGNKLTIKTFPQPGRTVAFDQCEVTVNGDKMAGTIDTNKGTIELVKSVPAQDR